MFSSLLSNFFSSIFGNEESVGNNIRCDNITSDEMVDDCLWASDSLYDDDCLRDDDCLWDDDLKINRVSNNLRVVPYNALTEVVTDELSEVTSDEMRGFEDDDFNFSNL